MSWRNTAERYGRLAKSFHWAVFLLILAMFPLGIIMTEPPITPDKFVLYKWHKTIGVLVLALVVARIAWRFLSPAPPLPAETPTIEKWAAHVTHFLLYVAIVTIPLSGWLMSSAAPFPNLILGNYQLPPLIGQDESVSNFLKSVHYWAGRALMALVILHITAALYHHFVRRDGILLRMLPGQFVRK